MWAMLPTPAGLADRVGELLRAHRARLRNRAYADTALNPPVGPCEVVPVTAGDGTRLRVHAYGPADGDVIVLAHGWTCCLEYWYPQINAFAGEYRVIAYDQRGHGESERGPARLSTDLLADDLAAVLEATLRPGQRAVLVGHSLGGATIQAWAQRYPERVSERAMAAVLVNSFLGDLIAQTTVVPGFGPKTLPLPHFLGKLLLSTPLSLPAVLPISWVLRRQVMTLASAGEIASFAQSIVRSCPAVVRAKVGFLLADLNLGRAATNLSVPTTVVAGAYDDLVPLAHAQRISEMLREAGTFEKLAVLPTGHLGNVEAHQEFNAELATVLAAAYERSAVATA